MAQIEKILKTIYYSKHLSMLFRNKSAESRVQWLIFCDIVYYEEKEIPVVHVRMYT